MPGFLYSSNPNVGVFRDHRDLISRRLARDEEFMLQQYTVNKFLDDKVTYSDRNFTILLEGVIFNFDKLLLEYGQQSRTELIGELYRIEGDTFCNKFRGSFSGLFYDRQSDKLIIFTDHIGDKPIFYSCVKGQLYAGSEIKFVTHMLRQIDAPIELDETAAYSALTFGYMTEQMTYVRDVKRLLGGNCLIFERGMLKIEQYFRFEYKPDRTMSQEAIIDRLDELFNAAVRSQVEKNREYGYQNWTSLSAGLDSRMTTYALERIVGRDFFSYTYSPVGFIDQKTSGEIAKQLQYGHYIHQATYCGSLLKEIDRSVYLNEGLYMYFGAAVINDFFEVFDKSKIGVIHTGQIGDVVVSTFANTEDRDVRSLKGYDLHSKKLAEAFYSRYEIDKLLDKYKGREMFSLYNRGFLGVNSGANPVLQNFTETYSPFCDVDFASFCYTIPFELRVDSKIYDKWIASKYPEAAKFRHNGLRFIARPMLNKLLICTNKVERRLRKVFIPDTKRPNSVTPLNSWSQIPDIARSLDEYYDSHLESFNRYPSLKDDIETLYRRGTALERNQVLTLLGAYDNLINEQ